MQLKSKLISIILLMMVTHLAFAQEYLINKGQWRTIKDQFLTGTSYDAATDSVLYSIPFSSATYLRRTTGVTTGLTTAMNGKKFVFSVNATGGAKMKLVFRRADWSISYATAALGNGQSETFVLPSERNSILLESWSGVNVASSSAHGSLKQVPKKNYLVNKGQWRTLKDQFITGGGYDAATDGVLYSIPFSSATYLRRTGGVTSGLTLDMNGKKFVFSVKATGGAKMKLVIRKADWSISYATAALGNGQSETFVLPSERNTIYLESWSGVNVASSGAHGELNLESEDGASAVACVGSYGACSKTCGGGTQTFTITTPASNGGAACEAVNGASRACNTQACPVDCAGSYGACSRMCGGGTQIFTVTTPAANGGAACPAETKACNTQSCVVPLPTDTVFAPTSFWYTPIPVDAPAHPRSEAFKADFIRQKTQYYNNVAVNSWQYSSPVYTVGPEVTPVKVNFWNCQNKTYVDKTFTEMMSAVPIPEYAVQATGTDAEMTIYQPSTDTIWEFWKTKKDAATGQWSACWGGRLQNASKSNGIFKNPYGTTATGLPFVGGQVTAEELLRGEIKHAIGISLVDTDHYDVVSWPATRSDGSNTSRLTNRIPEGLRLRLDPSVDVDKLPMSRSGKIIAKAAQKYGFVVWDRAGSISIRAQAPVSYTSQGIPNPYDGATGAFDGKAGYAVLNGFPWDKLIFLPMNYGKP